LWLRADFIVLRLSLPKVPPHPSTGPTPKTGCPSKLLKAIY
jgi:hypothetical protein